MSCPPPPPGPPPPNCYISNVLIKRGRILLLFFSQQNKCLKFWVIYREKLSKKNLKNKHYKISKIIFLSSFFISFCLSFCLSLYLFLYCFFFLWNVFNFFDLNLFILIQICQWILFPNNKSEIRIWRLVRVRLG
jgi:hypothetical protein